MEYSRPLGSYGQISSVPILNYFPISKKRGEDPFLFPKDTLSAFLNVDIENEDAVKEFCTDYQIFPRNLERGFYHGFVEEYNTLKPLASRAMSNALREEDLEFITNELENVTPQIKFSTERELYFMNEAINRSTPQDNVKKDSDKLHVIKARKQKTPMVRLYESLVDLTLKQQLLSTCKNCGNFFINNSKKKIFCIDECRDNYNHKKSYHRKK